MHSPGLVHFPKHSVPQFTFLLISSLIKIMWLVLAALRVLILSSGSLHLSVAVCSLLNHVPRMRWSSGRCSWLMFSAVLLLNVLLLSRISLVLLSLSLSFLLSSASAVPAPVAGPLLPTLRLVVRLFMLAVSPPISCLRHGVLGFCLLVSPACVACFPLLPRSSVCSRRSIPAGHRSGARHYPNHRGSS